MADKSSKKTAQQPPKTHEEFDDEPDELDGEFTDYNLDEGMPRPSNVRMRDWRDVERYREQRDLKKLVDDDLDDPSPSPDPPAAAKPRT